MQIAVLFLWYYVFLFILVVTYFHPGPGDGAFAEKDYGALNKVFIDYQNKRNRSAQILY